MRAGGRALSVLSSSLNVHVLKALEDEELTLAELSQAVGLPPVSTMRAYLKSLVELGALERRSQGGFPGSVSYAITPAGVKLLGVGEVLQNWLWVAPEGPISLGSTAAKSATKALVDGWSATIVRALAARPLALTELGRLIPQITYPTLERRLTAMRLVGLVEAQRNGSQRGTPYRATLWMRQATAPLSAAIAWERRYAIDPPPMGKLDVEAGFLLTIPLVEFPARTTGVCRLAIETRGGSEPQYAGVTITLDAGRPTSCVTRLEGGADAWVAGTTLDWFRWVNAEESQLELGGENMIGRAVAEGLREAMILGGVKVP
jgi:DNA-binding HxlR family transcriptional regulator